MYSYNEKKNSEEKIYLVLTMTYKMVFYDLYFGELRNMVVKYSVRIYF